MLKHRDFALHDFSKNRDFAIVILRKYQKQNQDDKKTQRLKKEKRVSVLKCLKYMVPLLTLQSEQNTIVGLQLKQIVALTEKFVFCYLPGWKTR